MQFPSIIDDLFSLQAIKFGSFLLKCGLISPIYIDLRQIISYPRLLDKISYALSTKVEKDVFDIVCGVPYATIPLTTTFSIKYHIPMIMCRKEEKKHGTKKRIEGVFRRGNRCLLLEDVVTSGNSLKKTAHHLRKEGIEVTALTVIDRQQGGKELLEAAGISLQSLFTLSDILEYLKERGSVHPDMIDMIQKSLEHAKVC